MDTTPRVELNMNLLPPRGKHATIFRVLDALAPGESMRLFIDHDPAPLRRQLAAERPNGFEWADEQEGPELWQVMLGRK
jgi:uncharacterized protein (DUF2249 family)